LGCCGSGGAEVVDGALVEAVTWAGDGDVDGVDCERTQRWHAEKRLECDEEVAGQR